MGDGARDELFRGDGAPSAFRFDGAVARVFDDMVARSVPIYGDVHRLVGDVVRRFLPDGGAVLDLGCSTGTTLAVVADALAACGKAASLTGIDRSPDMLARCREKLDGRGLGGAELVEADLEAAPLPPCDLAVMNYTLQFVRPAARPGLLGRVAAALGPGGILVMAEKVAVPGPRLGAMLEALHRDFKAANGYTDLEVARKREALEDVLVPLPPGEQVAMMGRAGFAEAEPVLRRGSFACYLGVAGGSAGPRTNAADARSSRSRTASQRPGSAPSAPTDRRTPSLPPAGGSLRRE